jgi:hypothetical protein
MVTGNALHTPQHQLNMGMGLYLVDSSIRHGLGVFTMTPEASPSHQMTVRKTIRILGVSLALIVLLVFATGVVSDWHHSGTTNDARCPYCHLGHQVPVQTEAPLCIAVLRPIAALPLLDEDVSATAPAFSQIAPRAPPSA